MFSDVIVMPRKAVPSFKPDVPWALIQVATNENTWPAYSTENCVGSYQIAFPDADIKLEHIEGAMFNRRKANAILDFIELVGDKIDLLAVHCEMGVSRSPAIAGALARHYLGDDFKFFNAPYTPNMVVYRYMMNAIEARYLVDKK